MAKVLMFHRVLPDKLITQPNAYSTFGTLISQEYFENVLSCLTDNGFQFTTVSTLAQQANTDKLVALTFDDGYSDNFEFALPSLQKFKATATFFPVVNPCKDNSVLPLDTYYQCVDEAELSETERNDFISGDTKKKFYWSEPEQQKEFLKTSFQKLPTQNRVSYLRTDQIKSLADSGFEIGSHSVTHSLFTAEYMNESKINFELKQSKIYLEEITGKPVTSFCFPSGYYNSKTIELAKENGYTSVCLIKKNKNEEVQALPSFERIFVKPNSISELLTALK
ncbi:MAG: polysaccharide deacetylase family protein [Vicingaceae bacterium]|nr:MAG: polysaccharide deacetylase family protein [Vicingaceae bacterium]